ncbi:MAG: hypothetical protein L0211_03830 [Planctomycetaceae bacterium]|nr:hypothetical protein [Planctomycetaceae bacterium]
MNSVNKLGWGPIAAGLLLAANVVVPLVWGDVYPFTSAPMFRDNPRQCCNYRVLAPDGIELAAGDWLCQRIYDGNPLGYGVGIKPPAVIEQCFGDVHTEDQIRQHIERLLAAERHEDVSSVEVVQEVIGPIDAERVGVVATNRIVVRRAGN